LATIAVVVAVSGIGFAAFTSSAYINGSAAAGTFYLYWSNPGASGSQPYNVCPVGTITSTSNESDTLVISASNLAPGDYCTFTATLNDGGSLPGQVWDSITSLSASCWWFYSDNFGGHAAPPLPEPLRGPIGISPSSPIAYSANLGLNGGQTNGCQGATLSFTLTFSATAS
jgi:hypothetical protein